MLRHNSFTKQRWWRREDSVSKKYKKGNNQIWKEFEVKIPIKYEKVLVKLKLYRVQNKIRKIKHFSCWKSLWKWKERWTMIPPSKVHSSFLYSIVIVSPQTDRLVLNSNMLRLCQLAAKWHQALSAHACPRPWLVKPLAWGNIQTGTAKEMGIPQHHAPCV